MRGVAHMKFAVLVGRLAAAPLCVAIAAEAAARELRHPGPGTPAFTVQVPDDWTHLVADDNLIAVSRDETMSIVVAFWTHAGPLEEAAKIMLEGGDATASTGKRARPAAELTIVRIGVRGYGAATKIEGPAISPEQRRPADTVMQIVRIVAAK